MKIIDFLQTQNDEDKLALLLCPNEYDLPNFDDDYIQECTGENKETCKKCWEFALRTTMNN